MEIWKEVDGYEGLYEVSNYGKVISLPRLKYGRYGKHGIRQSYMTKLKLLSPKVDKDGYLSVTLTDYDGNRVMHRVHRLVAIAFIDKVDGKDVVHHKDGNVENNTVNNLAWVTTQENLWARDVFAELSDKFSTPVLCKTLTGEVVDHFQSVREAANRLSLDPRHISSVLNGRRKHIKGYVFEREVAG
mgnify:CR=1 FL=1